MWQVTAEGRDKGKWFKITEMFSSKGEKWAYRALLAILNNKIELPEGFESAGWAGLAQVGFQGLTGLPWHLAEPLLDEMMPCVQIVPDYPKFNLPRALEDAPEAPGGGDVDIEEPATRFQLRWEVFKLHTDFSDAAALSLIARVKAVMAAKDRESNIATASPE